MYRSTVATGAFVAVTLLLAPLSRSPQAQEGMLFKNMFGAMGLIAEDKEPIEYRERAPLVLPPPRMGLREPARHETAQGRSAHWPQDPDVAARKRREADARVPVTEIESRRALDDTYRSSPIVEQRVGRSAGAKVPDGPVVRESDSARLDLPWLRSEQTKRPQQEPPQEVVRRSLTEPPSSYRRSATGEPIRGSFEAPVREDESTHAFIRGQQGR